MDPNKTSSIPSDAEKSTPTKRRRRRTTAHASPHFPSETPPLTPSPLKRQRSSRHATTTSKSPHFPSSPSSAKKKQPRPPAGTTHHAIFPPLTAARFGIIQEELAHTPFQLLLAVILLNQTSGRAAVPVFRRLVAAFPDPAAVGNEARFEELEALVQPLGLKKRARAMARLARQWMEDAPRRGRRWSLRGRNPDYPVKGAGREVAKGEVLRDEDEVVEVEVRGGDGEVVVERRRDERRAALEIGHLVGCGAYAWDSWRIFCRDELRGLKKREWIRRKGDIETENGKPESSDRRAEKEDGGKVDGKPNSDFEEEWKRVLPKDKELRPFLGWMWLKEGYIWDPETGFKEKASEDLMQRATNGRIDWLEELQIWRDDLSRRQIIVGESVRPTEGKIEGPKRSYLDMLSSSGSSDELSDVPSDEDLEEPV